MPNKPYLAISYFFKTEKLFFKISKKLFIDKNKLRHHHFKNIYFHSKYKEQHMLAKTVILSYLLENCKSFFLLLIYINHPMSIGKMSFVDSSG
jgi:hypothetical protein